MILKLLNTRGNIILIPKEGNLKLQPKKLKKEEKE